jgi:hypothetical protein
MMLPSAQTKTTTTTTKRRRRMKLTGILCGCG